MATVVQCSPVLRQKFSLRIGLCFNRRTVPRFIDLPASVGEASVRVRHLSTSLKTQTHLAAAEIHRCHAFGRQKVLRYGDYQGVLVVRGLCRREPGAASPTVIATPLSRARGGRVPRPPSRLPQRRGRVGVAPPTSSALPPEGGGSPRPGEQARRTRGRDTAGVAGRSCTSLYSSPRLPPPPRRHRRASLFPSGPLLPKQGSRDPWALVTHTATRPLLLGTAGRTRGSSPAAPPLGPESLSLWEPPHCPRPGGPPPECP